MYNFHFNQNHNFWIIITIKHIQKLESNWHISNDFLVVQKMRTFLWGILKHTKNLKAFGEVFGRKKQVQIFKA